MGPVGLRVVGVLYACFQAGLVMFLVVPLSNELAPLEWVLPGLVWPLSNEPCSSRMGFAAQDGKVLLSSASACMKRRGAPLLAAWALLPFVFPSCLGLPSRF